MAYDIYLFTMQVYEYTATFKYTATVTWSDGYFDWANYHGYFNSENLGEIILMHTIFPTILTWAIF